LEHKAKKGSQAKFTPDLADFGVPQGGVLSGLLSNLYLSEFDAAIRRRHEAYRSVMPTISWCAAKVKRSVSGCTNSSKTGFNS